MSLTPVQQGGGSGVQRDVERVDSFELGVEEQQDALAIQSSFAVAHASSIIASVGTQSSASSTQVIPHSSNIIAQPLSTGVVPRLARHSFMGHGDEYLHADDLKRVLGSAPDPLSRPALLNALAYKCKNKACDLQCSKRLDEINLFHLRQAWAIQVNLAGFGDASRSSDAAKHTILHHYTPPSDGSLKGGSFKNIEVQVEDRCGTQRSVELCVPTWAVCVANLGKSTMEKVRADVPKIHRDSCMDSCRLELFGRTKVADRLLGFQNGERSNESQGETFRMVVSYVREYCSTLEMNPAPGACRTIEYIAPRETWDDRLKQCLDHFHSKGVRISVGVKTLVKAWRSVASLIDKTMKSHSKCDTCALIDAQLRSLVGKTDEASTTLRKLLLEKKAAHRKLMASERAELDDAGYRSFMYPLLQLTLIADGATQRNFMLPKLRQRLPKELATKELFCSKLYGVFVYGYGMNCYVIHESVGGGANLSSTCIYLTLLDAVKSGRPLPEELHFQLDNTSAENKCSTMFCFAGWLVKNGWVKRVRIFFLAKGHTHVIIDQIFGSITKYIRCRNVFTPQQLLKCIQDVVSRSRKYSGRKVERLHHLFDWASFFDGFHTGIGGYHTSAYNDSGYHDFVVSLNDDGHPVLNMKKFAATEEFVSEGPFLIFKEGAFETMAASPPILDVKGDSAWDREDFNASYRVFEQYFGLSEEELHPIRQQWTDALENTAPSTSSLKLSNRIYFEALPDAIVNDGSELPSSCLQLRYTAQDDISNPPVCTVFGGHRSQATVKKEIEAWLVSQRGGKPIPTSPLCTISLYSTDFILVDRGGRLPSLFCITRRVQSHLPPSSPAVEVRCVLYKAASDTDSDFLGPYKRCSGEGSTCIVSRAEVLVYNVTFHKVKGNRSERFLSVDTLQALYDVQPHLSAAIDGIREKHSAYALVVPVARGIARKQPARTARRRPDSDDGSDDDISSPSDEEDDESDGLGDASGGFEPAVEGLPADDENEVEDVEDESYELIGERKTGEFVWIDLEGDASMKGYKYPIALGQCTSDEAASKVNVGWFGAYDWKSKALSHSNSTYATWYEDKKEGIQLTQLIEVSGIVPIRVELAAHKTFRDGSARVTVAPGAIDAVKEWVEKQTKSAKRSRRK